MDIIRTLIKMKLIHGHVYCHIKTNLKIINKEE